MQCNAKVHIIIQITADEGVFMDFYDYKNNSHHLSNCFPLSSP